MSPGVAVGESVVVRFELPDVPQRVVAPAAVGQEVARLQAAVAAVRAHIEGLRQRAEERVGREDAKIFDAQLLMLEDADMLSAVERLIRENQLSAERAYEFKALEVRAQWARSPSELVRDRVADLSGLQIWMLRFLLDLPLDVFVRGDADGKSVIVCTRELTPGLTVQVEGDRVAGLVSEEGTRTSHAAILARSLGIPCVMGLVGGLARLTTGDRLVLDGSRGTVLLRPSAAEVRDAQAHERRRRALDRQLEKVVGQPATSLDGVTISLRGNLDRPEELDAVADHGAEGVGLLRTEFLLVGRAEMPTEDEQARYFERVGRRFSGHPVLVRSFDLGGDKFPAAFRTSHEANPFLGWRAIRVCLDQPDMFRAQLRAALRARRHADIRLMLPLVTQLDEVEQTRQLVEESAAELERRGTDAARDIPIGVMVETPAAALLATELAQRVDFLSVGSNDLTQYTLAVDRGNARLAGRFSAFHPAVVRMLKMVCDAGAGAGRDVSVCGEMASDPLAVFLLLGLGYRALSVSPPALPLVRWVIRQIDIVHARQAAEAALAASTTEDVTRLVEAALSEHVNLRFLDAGRLPKGRRATTFRA